MFAQITVKKVFVKELASEDRNGNTHSVSILGKDEYGDEIWYSLGTTRQSKFGQIKVKAGMITEDAEIEFDYTENGKYKNMKPGTIEITKEGKAPDEGKSYGGKGKGGYSKGGGKSSGFDNVGIAVGAAMNQAVSLVAAGSVEYDEVATVARELYAVAEEIKAEAAGGGAKKERAPAKKQRQRKQPKAESIDDDFDDDIPF